MPTQGVPSILDRLLLEQPLARYADNTRLDASLLLELFCHLNGMGELRADADERDGGSFVLIQDVSAAEDAFPARVTELR